MTAEVEILRGWPGMHMQAHSSYSPDFWRSGTRHRKVCSPKSGIRPCQGKLRSGGKEGVCDASVVLVMMKGFAMPAGQNRWPVWLCGSACVDAATSSSTAVLLPVFAAECRPMQASQTQPVHIADARSSTESLRSAYRLCKAAFSP